MIFEKQIEKVFRSALYGRCDDNGSTFYFSHKDFKGLNAEPYSFVSSAGNKLKGYFYSYENALPDKLIVFDHGYGGGHRSYMKEIEKLCSGGYRVFAYDHTGCMESEGESTNGFAQSLCDLNDCLNALKADKNINTTDISVMGHSWGGFSCLNICALHPDITQVVVLSGFASVKKMVEQNFSGLLKGYRKHIYEVERASNPDFAGYDAAESLSKTNARVLLIYSDDDKMVNKSIHFDYLKNALAGKDNIKLLLAEGKGHNPNYTKDALVKLNGFIEAKKHAVKKKSLSTEEQKKAFVSSFDWDKMTEQDETVWKEIFDTLKK